MQIFASLLITGSLSVIIYQATKESSSVTFFTPAEIYEKPENFIIRPFRVGGLVLAGTKNWDANNKILQFRLTDLKGHDFYVRYKGVPPDLFKEGQGVVVEGRLKSADLKVDNTIDASLLMVKHSEVYDENADHSELRQAKLLDSVLDEKKK